MRFHPGQVLGTAFTWLLGAISVVATRDMAATICAILGIIAAIFTCLNGYLNARKTRLEIKALEEKEGPHDAS